MKRRLICCLLSTTLAVLFAPNQAAAKQYYVNSSAGNNSNSGTKRSSPWQSLAPVHATSLQPGDTVNFECGSRWNTGLDIRSSGTQSNPITFRAIGEGAKPVISNAGKMTKAIDITGSWVVVDGFLARDASYAGIALAKGADHNIVSNCEITNCGMGVMMRGSYNLITHNDAHDLVMIKNTPGGNDDYGAVAYWTFGPHNEIAYNRAIRCRAPSCDYGADGGFFEIYDNGDNTYVHHNYAENCNGFLEVGGGSARNVVVRDNVSVENDIFCFHLGKDFRADIENFRLENNTIIAKKGTTWHAMLDWGGGIPQTNTLVVRNNLIVLGGGPAERISKLDGFTHEGNTYFLLHGARTGFPLGLNEHAIQSPDSLPEEGHKPSP